MHAGDVRSAEGLGNECNAKACPHERQRSRYFTGILNYPGVKAKPGAERDGVATKCRSALIGDENKRLLGTIPESRVLWQYENRRRLRVPVDQ